ncbi:MAG: FHA domain-containing protein [Planctomycetota bacterium]|nr:FHA domain-containing protein [Planctomycetota bacterium]
MTPPPRTTPRFLLAVDDAGEFLAVVGEDIRLGHVRAKDVDLPFLADVAAHHARLSLVEDFHAGAGWRIAPETGAAVAVNGHAIGEQGVLLADGDEVRLAPNLAFRFVARERGSSSARLELGGGQECLGAPRVLLLAPGAGGRARIGAGTARLVPLADLEHEIEISAERSAEAASVSVRCTAGIAAVARGAGEPEVRLALPLGLAVTLTARARGPGKPPFALIFRSADAPLEG